MSKIDTGFDTSRLHQYFADLGDVDMYDYHKPYADHLNTFRGQASIQTYQAVQTTDNICNMQAAGTPETETSNGGQAVEAMEASSASLLADTGNVWVVPPELAGNDERLAPLALPGSLPPVPAPMPPGNNAPAAMPQNTQKARGSKEDWSKAHDGMLKVFEAMFAGKLTPWSQNKVPYKFYAKCFWLQAMLLNRTSCLINQYGACPPGEWGRNLYSMMGIYSITVLDRAAFEAPVWVHEEEKLVISADHSKRCNAVLGMKRVQKQPLVLVFDADARNRETLKVSKNHKSGIEKKRKMTENHEGQAPPPKRPYVEP